MNTKSIVIFIVSVSQFIQVGNEQQRLLYASTRSMRRITAITFDYQHMCECIKCGILTILARFLSFYRSLPLSFPFVLFHFVACAFYLYLLHIRNWISSVQRLHDHWHEDFVFFFSNMLFDVFILCTSHHHHQLTLNEPTNEDWKMHKNARKLNKRKNEQANKWTNEQTTERIKLFEEEASITKDQQNLSTGRRKRRRIGLQLL